MQSHDLDGTEVHRPERVNGLSDLHHTCEGVRIKRSSDTVSRERKEERKGRTWTEDEHSSLLSFRVGDGVGGDGGDEIGVELVRTRDGIEDLDRARVETATLVLGLERLELLFCLSLTRLAESTTSSLGAGSILKVFDDVLKILSKREREGGQYGASEQWKTKGRT